MVRYKAAKVSSAPPGSPQRMRDMVASKLAATLWERICKYKTELQGFPQKDTCDLLIVDRTVDPVGSPNLYCTVLYCTVLHCSACAVLYCAALRCTVQYSTVMDCAILHGTGQWTWHATPFSAPYMVGSCTQSVGTQQEAA